MAVQLVERLPADDLADGIERWLVHDGGIAPRIALLADAKQDAAWWLMSETFEPWIGVSHPALTAHLASGRAPDRRLMVVHEDDRGPTLAQVARMIASPIDRERWAVAELCAICDGIAAMAARLGPFVHRRATDERTFVDETGHARLRAYLGGFLRSNVEGDQRGPFTFSPEQIRGRPLEPPSDVFQLGCVLYLALDGTHPFSRGQTSLERLASILDDPTPAPPRTTSPQLAQIIQIALAKRTEDRFPDPVAFAAAMRACVPPVAVEVYAEAADVRASLIAW